MEGIFAQYGSTILECTKSQKFVKFVEEKIAVKNFCLTLRCDRKQIFT
jgi:hypothetical protein